MLFFDRITVYKLDYNYCIIIIIIIIIIIMLLPKVICCQTINMPKKLLIEYA